MLATLCWLHPDACYNLMLTTPWCWLHDGHLVILKLRIIFFYKIKNCLFILRVSTPTHPLPQLFPRGQHQSRPPPVKQNSGRIIAFGCPLATPRIVRRGEHSGLVPVQMRHLSYSEQQGPFGHSEVEGAAKTHRLQTDDPALDPDRLAHPWDAQLTQALGLRQSQLLEGHDVWCHRAGLNGHFKSSMRWKHCSPFCRWCAPR